MNLKHLTKPVATSFAVICLLATVISCADSNKENAEKEPETPQFYAADNDNFEYVGRIDFSNEKLPRFWAPGVYIKAKFEGSDCKVVLNDEELYETNHNYVTVKIDDNPEKRIKLSSATDTLDFSEGLSGGDHEITICKTTEGGIGYMEFVGLECEKLLAAPELPERKIEFIGNSITCGYGGNDSEIPCNQKEWYDEHDAYNAYGPLTARALNAQWHLNAVSGIGLIHSCCNMELLMPQAYDNICLKGDSVPWDFSKYTPDLVSICLGQNDGVQDSTAFCSAYVEFVERVRTNYPEATILFVGSPMADQTLWPVLENYLNSVVQHFNANGEDNIASFFFEEQYIAGCDTHPSNAEHQKMADQLTAFVKELKGW